MNIAQLIAPVVDLLDVGWISEYDLSKVFMVHAQMSFFTRFGFEMLKKQ